ncbi:MAG: hypothetical protein R3237_03350 [Nitrosopumilaceae archaeon]|nr:hypothetical protein [Nitrosopumilaceae archaeon]
MREESCRRCGNELEIKQKCHRCNDGISFQCTNCNFETDKKFHFTCTQLDSKNKIFETSLA